MVELEWNEKDVQVGYVWWRRLNKSNCQKPISEWADRAGLIFQMRAALSVCQEQHGF